MFRKKWAIFHLKFFWLEKKIRKVCQGCKVNSFFLTTQWDQNLHEILIENTSHHQKIFQTNYFKNYFRHEPGVKQHIYQKFKCATLFLEGKYAVNLFRIYRKTFHENFLSQVLSIMKLFKYSNIILKRSQPFCTILFLSYMHICLHEKVLRVWTFNKDVVLHQAHDKSNFGSNLLNTFFCDG